MVIIGVEEGYREARTVAMRVGLCRSAERCGELVECLVLPWCFRGLGKDDVEIFCSTWNICGCLGAQSGDQELTPFRGSAAGLGSLSSQASAARRVGNASEPRAMVHGVPRGTLLFFAHTPR